MFERFVFSLFALLLCAGSLANAQDVRRSQVITAEAQLNDATASHDTKSVEALLTYDYMFIGPNAAVLDRDDVIRTVQDQRIVFKTNRAHDQRVRFYGDNVAVVTGVLDQDYSISGQHRANSLRYTAVWVLDRNTWRQASGQASTLQASAGSSP